LNAMILRRLKANDYKMPTHALPVKICRFNFVRLK